MESTKEIESEVTTKKVRGNLPDLKTMLTTSYNGTLSLDLMHRISIAPMLDITNIHFRFFMRLLTKHSTLWTEMVHENAILHNKLGIEEFLKFNPVEHPVVLQIGGNSPESLVKCAKYAEFLGYDEINLNVGCPSAKVQEGAFGACLMKEPELVSECCLAMRRAVQIPVTIKTRLGVDDFDSYDFAKEFIKTTSQKAELGHYIIHARKAYLKGLNPKENRTIPPLHYDRVLKLKQELPHLEFTINGGFKDFKSIQEILKTENKLKGCMIGRAAYETPWIFADVDRVFYGKKNLGYSRREILEIWAEYGEKQMEEDPGMPFQKLAKPIINLWANQKNNAKYKQFLSEVTNFKAHNSNFKDLIYGCIEHMEKFSKATLDEKPPLEDPKDPFEEEPKISVENLVTELVK